MGTFPREAYAANHMLRRSFFWWLYLIRVYIAISSYCDPLVKLTSCKQVTENWTQILTYWQFFDLKIKENLKILV